MSLAWKAKVLPLNYSRETWLLQTAPEDAFLPKTFAEGLALGLSGGGGWIRTTVGVSQQIYSLPPLATRAPLRRACDYNTAGVQGSCQSTAPRPLAARNRLAALKWPQPMKGTGGLKADSGDG